MKCVIHAQRLLDWLQTEGDISTREEGVTLGQDLYATGILRHATDDKNFKDIDTCYRFTADDAHERAKEKDRRPTAITRMEFASSQVLSCLTLTVRLQLATRLGAFFLHSFLLLLRCHS